MLYYHASCATRVACLQVGGETSPSMVFPKKTDSPVANPGNKTAQGSHCLEGLVVAAATIANPKAA